MQVIAVDVGNSSIKLLHGELQQDNVKRTDDFCVSFPSQVDSKHLNDVPAGHWLISSVNSKNETNLRKIASESSLVESWTNVSREMLPLSLEVDQPDAVGIDRLLAAFAAFARYSSNKPCIVIDCGTALTIDVVSEQGAFLGGSIIAGPRASLKALADLTDALPDLSDQHVVMPVQPIGKSTAAAMMAGAYFAQVGAIRQLVETYSSVLPDPVVVGTGGAIGQMIDDLPENWILVENLVLEGLFQIAPQVFDQTE